jgi:hypothetical protein
MTDLPGRKDINIYRGNDFAKTFAFLEPGGRGITDLVITSGSTAATSATANFTSADTGKKIVSIGGTGITDGTTMTYVSSTQVTLSASATATATNVAAAVRGINCSAYSGHAAEMRATEDSAVLATFSVDSSRKAVGVFTVSLDATTTAALTLGGVWDWQVTGPNGVTTWISGKAKLTKDVTHD